MLLSYMLSWVKLLEIVNANLTYIQGKVKLRQSGYHFERRFSYVYIKGNLVCYIHNILLKLYVILINILGVPAKEKNHVFGRRKKWEIYFVLMVIHVCFLIMISHTIAKKKGQGKGRMKKKKRKRIFPIMARVKREKIV